MQLDVYLKKKHNWANSISKVSTVWKVNKSCQTKVEYVPLRCSGVRSTNTILSKRKDTREWAGESFPCEQVNARAAVWVAYAWPPSTGFCYTHAGYWFDFVWVTCGCLGVRRKRMCWPLEYRTQCFSKLLITIIWMKFRNIGYSPSNYPCSTESSRKDVRVFCEQNYANAHVWQCCGFKLIESQWTWIDEQ